MHLVLDFPVLNIIIYYSINYIVIGVIFNYIFVYFFSIFESLKVTLLNGIQQYDSI